jgi:hypothetical protein
MKRRASDGEGKIASAYAEHASRLPVEQLCTSHIPHPRPAADAAASAIEKYTCSPARRAPHRASPSPGSTRHYIPAEADDTAALSLVTAHLGATSLCRDCGADEDSIIHAVNCLREDRAA